MMIDADYRHARASLANELAGVASRLLEEGTRESISEPTLLAARARQWLGLYHRRAQVFGQDSDLFGDPAWAILLDLYLSRHEGRRVSVSSATLASGAAPTTGLRVLALLQQRGMVVRSPDEEDRRRSWVSISQEAVSRVEAVLAQA